MEQLDLGWLIVVCGATLGALIATMDGSAIQSAMGGMGRAEFAMDDVYAMPPGETVDMAVGGRDLRMWRPGDGLIHAMELLPDGTFGEEAILSQRGQLMSPGRSGD